MALAVFSGSPMTSLPNNEQVSLTPSISQQALTPLNWDTPVEVLHLKENEVIFKEGETPKGIYLLKSGALKSYVNRATTRGRMSSPEYVTKVIAPGEIFGFEAVIKGKAYASSVKTLRPSEVHVFSKEAILSVLNGPNSILKAVLQQAMKDADTHEKVSELHYLASVQERIAYQLVLLADRFGVPTENGISLNLRLTRNELAQLAGTINESLSRHLTELKNDGVLEIFGKEIVIKDRKALMERSGNFKI